MQSVLEYGIWDFTLNVLIYTAVVVPFFLIFWKWCSAQLQHRRIQSEPRSTPTVRRQELLYSVSTLFIFTGVDVLIYIAQINGYTQAYWHISDFGWAYFAFSVVLMIVLHDAWFYWSHRLMHHPKIFRYVHKVHHQSVDPSPFAAFSFHPLEALVEAAPYAIFAFLFPIHLGALLIWQLVQMFLNVIGHLGYEIYPRGFNTHWLFKWKTPSTHHNQHHAKFNGNYGLYFTWWDRWFGTEFKDYHATYEQLQNRIAAKNASESAEKVERLPQ